METALSKILTWRETLYIFAQDVFLVTQFTAKKF